jgi:rhombotail lipoprotein
MKTINLLVTVALLGAVAALSGCESFNQRSQHRATSVVKFLYPNNSEHVESPTVPVLSLPLKVGIAFVPVEESRRGAENYLLAGDATVNESQKMALMKEVSKHFDKYPFVKSIELIPTAYLTPGGSFANLDQLRSMFDVDVIALLSYDQVQFTDEGILSLSYWTIVGAYTVTGEKNDTRTMLDAVVYDIPSRKMLFRSPGLSHIKGSATPINLSEELRLASEAGFQQAATNLVAGLDFQLGEFKERIKKSPEDIKVVNKPGYAGASAMGGFEVLLLGGMAFAGFFLRRKSV